ncbi:restriction endonuclease subunit S [Clostridium sardiniense]|uniref:restriction endonuclease subunit S n=1 Tax=Clostridium sardiniense TaxID=29369 RepID=UPI00195A07FE|nr:restriction endonuclease subunit S [Clostridium sardiniense]MBM7834926.1 type I restriction enzyme S subunit [Clostridium sardiniense]
MAKKKVTLEEKLEDSIVKDVSYEVPDNWVNVKLNSIVKFEKGKKPKLLIEKFEDNAIPYVTIKYFQTKEADQYTFETETNRLCDEDDILIVWDGARAGLIGTGVQGALGSTLCKIKFNCMNKKFMYYYFVSKYNLINANTKGTGIPHVDSTYLEKLTLGIPPLKEQQRIVDKIESLFEKLDKAKELIEEARDGFEKRKSAILEKAFRGKLTEKWRKTNIISENRILAEINKFYCNRLSKRDMEILCDFQSKIDEYEMIKDSKWVKCCIGAIGKVSNGSTPSRKNEAFWNGTIPWVSSGEVRNNRIKYTKEYITEDGFNNSSVKLLSKGSVLIAMIGEGKTRGQSSILDIESTTNQNIAAIDLSHENILSEFLWYWLQYNYKKNRDSGNGTGPKALNCQKVRELDFILPPKNEQKEIVRILDKILGEESKIEELTQLETQIELIKKSILAKAFRSELGTNNSEEISAIELLNNILDSNLNR